MNLLQFQLQAIDPNNDPIIYSATGLPTGAVIDPATGQFSWTPAYKQAGKYTVVLSASDGSLAAKQTIVITVVNVPMPDLVMGAITCTPTTFVAGKVNTFKATITNSGDGATDQFVAWFTVDGGSKLETTVPSIAAGKTAALSFAWTAVKGSHTILIVADPTNVYRSRTRAITWPQSR